MSIQYVRDAGVAPGANGYFDTPDLSPTNLTMKNVGTVPAVLTLVDMLGAKSEPITIAPNAPLLIENMSLHQYSLTGNGALVVMYAGWPEKVNPDYIQTGSRSGAPESGTTISILAGIPKALYAVPPGFRFTLSSIAVTGTVGDTLFLFIQRQAIGALLDWISPIETSSGVGGMVIPAVGSVYFGEGPNDNVTWADAPILYAGDILYAETLNHNGTGYVAGLLEPL